MPSIVIVRRANAAFVSFSKRWIVHEFMIMDRLQSALIIDVTFSVPNIGGNRRCCGSDISLFVSAERFFQSRVPCERFIFEPARIKFWRSESAHVCLGCFQSSSSNRKPASAAAFLNVAVSEAEGLNMTGPLYGIGLGGCEFATR